MVKQMIPDVDVCKLAKGFVDYNGRDKAIEMCLDQMRVMIETDAPKGLLKFWNDVTVEVSRYKDAEVK